MLVEKVLQVVATFTQAYLRNFKSWNDDIILDARWGCVEKIRTNIGILRHFTPFYEKIRHFTLGTLGPNVPNVKWRIMANNGV